MRFVALTACILAICGLIAVTAAHEYTIGNIDADHPWSRATKGQNGAVYVTLINKGDRVDRLLGAASPVAKRVEMHTHLMEEGVMKMRRIDAVEVHPGNPSILQPGGLHIMLIGLRHHLMEGEFFPLTLIFENAGRIEVEAKVEKAGAREPSGAEQKMEHEHDD